MMFRTGHDAYPLVASVRERSPAVPDKHDSTNCGTGPTNGETRGPAPERLASNTFDGFPPGGKKDKSDFADPQVGELRSSSYDELQQLITEYDRDRFLGHLPKVELVKGDITKSAPAFIESHPHLVVSLLFIDCDLYDPTRAALDAFMPRMPKGAVVAFDELDNPIWPGETLAALDSKALNGLRLRRFEWDPYISYAIIE